MIIQEEQRELFLQEFRDFAQAFYDSGAEIVTAELMVKEFWRETQKTIKVEDAKLVMKE